MAQVLLITKTPLSERLAAADLARLERSGAIEDARLRTAAENHRATLQVVRAALAPDQVRECAVETVSAADALGCDLIVTVGGDGTVFTANTLGVPAPLITVNSDPVFSIGHFTRAAAASVGSLISHWRAGSAVAERLPRLEVEVAGRAWRFLNDCLCSSSNPAAMTRYLLEVDGRRERQRSSGIWVATAAGSTAAIRSAGAEPVPAATPALLYRVREPFPGGDELHLLAGTQQPPRGLVLIAATPGISLYLDGPNITVPLAPGDAATFRAAREPLTLLAAPSM